MQQLGAQQSPQGIAALAMGNPAPLQKRVAQGGKDPQTGLPKDLVSALALNIVTNEGDAAKRQMAMQQLQQASGQTGQMPTVVQSLQQQAEQKMQAQAMQARQQQQGLQALMQKAPAGPVPAGTPQPEAQPQAGIDQLPVEFGMAEGGIVAFSGEDGSEVPEDEKYETPYDRMNRKNRGEMTEAELKKERAREALISQIPTGGPTVEGGERVSGSELGRNVSNTMMALPGASASRALSGSAGSARGLMAALTGLLGRGEPKETPAAPPKGTPAAPPKGTMPAPGYTRGAMENDPRLATPPTQPVRDLAAPKNVRQGPPQAAPTAAPQEARPVQAAPESQGLSALLEKTIRADLGRDRDTEAQKMVEKQRGLMGMDAYQKSLAENTAARQAAMEKVQANRTPEWARGLASLSGAPVRGGIGMMLGKAGSTAAAARDEYGAEDLKVSKELMDLKNAASKALMDGNMQLAKTYAEQYKEVDAARRAALQSGTSLENTRESARSREQVAADALAARKLQARLASEAKTAGLADKADERFREQAMKMAMAAATKEKTLPANMVKYKDITTEELASSMYDRIYNALKTGKMAPAPGAGSPGGTSTSGWGKAQVVK